MRVLSIETNFADLDSFYDGLLSNRGVPLGKEVLRYHEQAGTADIVRGDERMRYLAEVRDSWDISNEVLAEISYLDGGGDFSFNAWFRALLGYRDMIGYADAPITGISGEGYFALKRACGDFIAIGTGMVKAFSLRLLESSFILWVYSWGAVHKVW